MCVSGRKDLRALGIVCHISSITRLLYWAWHGSDPYCHLQICLPPAHTHTEIHTWTWTHIHAHTSISEHACCKQHTHAYTKPAHMAWQEFIWCFLVIATKTPNLDVSRLFPKTPERRANFKQLPLFTAQTSVLFPLLPPCFFFSFILSFRVKNAGDYLQDSSANSYFVTQKKKKKKREKGCSCHSALRFYIPKLCAQVLVPWTPDNN